MLAAFKKLQSVSLWNPPNDAVDADQVTEPGTVLCCWQIGDDLQQQQQSGWTVAEKQQKQSRNDGKEEMALVLLVVASNGSHNRFPSQQRASIVNLRNKSMLPDNKNLSFQYICVFYEDTCIHIMYIIYMYVFYETLWPIQKSYAQRESQHSENIINNIYHWFDFSIHYI